MGASVVARVAEYRNAVNAYNSSFARCRAYKASFLFGIVYPAIPSQMKLLIINPVSNESPNNYEGGNQISPATPNTSGVPQPETQKSVTSEEVQRLIEEALKGR